MQAENKTSGRGIIVCAPLFTVWLRTVNMYGSRCSEFPSSLAPGRIATCPAST